MLTPEAEAAQEQAGDADSQGGPPQNQPPPQAPRPTLPENAVDAPLVRLFNFLRESGIIALDAPAECHAVEMMSLSYQLEILHYQVRMYLELATPASAPNA
jgi:hypothetical protein